MIKERAHATNILQIRHVVFLPVHDAHLRVELVEEDTVAWLEDSLTNDQVQSVPEGCWANFELSIAATGRLNTTLFLKNLVAVLAVPLDDS